MTSLVDGEGAAVDPEVAQRAADGVLAAQAKALSKALADGARAFVAPVEKNTRILVSSKDDRKVLTVMDASTPMGRRETARVNDVYVEFTGGVTIIRPDDPYYMEKVEWCEGHPEKCRDATNPETEVWSKMKEAQLDLMNREPSLDPSINVDAVIAGDLRGLGKADSLVGRALTLLGQAK